MKRVFLTLLLLLVAFASDSAMAGGWTDFNATWKGGSRKKPWSFALELGSRFSYKYNRVSVLSTPPESILAEAQLQVWYRRSFAFYASYAQSISLGPESSYSFGAKLPFLTFDNSTSGAVGSISFMLVGDVANHSFNPPAVVTAYPPSFWAFRYGGSIKWTLGRIYLDTTMMVNTMNNNFFIAPLIGLGLHF